ncbi:IS1595 family transposase [Chloroflexota bacterium]
MKTYTIKNFDKQFPDDNACLEFLYKARYPKGVTCRKCQKVTTHYRITSRKVYCCEFCGHTVSPTANTIFHKSDTPLRSWFHAIFIMSSTRTGISAKQLQRELGVTYKTAWRMFKQIRQLMQDSPNALFGQVEVDDTYIGGKRTGKRGRGAEGKTIVIGMVERKGNAVAKVVPDVKASTLLPVITKHAPNTEDTTIYTDELTSYNRINKLGYAHEVVQHAAKQYVCGKAHVNTVESLWSTIKRGIDGVNHSVRPQYLQSYLDSYLYRYNHRKDETPMFLSLLERISSLAVVEQPS